MNLLTSLVVAKNSKIGTNFISSLSSGSSIHVLIGRPFSESKVYAMGNKSFKMIQQLRDTKTGEVKTVSHCVLVSIDRATGTTKPVDEAYRRAIVEFEKLND